MESLIDRMRDEDDGIPVRSYTRLGKKVRSVFTGNVAYTLSQCFFVISLSWSMTLFSFFFAGSDLISWIMKNINVDDEGNECRSFFFQPLILHKTVIINATVLGTSKFQNT